MLVGLSGGWGLCPPPFAPLPPTAPPLPPMGLGLGRAVSVSAMSTDLLLLQPQGHVKVNQGHLEVIKVNRMSAGEGEGHPSGGQRLKVGKMHVRLVCALFIIDIVLSHTQ